MIDFKVPLQANAQYIITSIYEGKGIIPHKQYVSDAHTTCNPEWTNNKYRAHLFNTYTPTETGVLLDALKKLLCISIPKDVKDIEVVQVEVNQVVSEP